MNSNILEQSPRWRCLTRYQDQPVTNLPVETYMMIVGAGVSDEALMIRVTTGDMDALGELFERYRQPLHGFLYRLLHDAASAEDALVDVFVRVFERRQTFKQGGTFSCWLYTIAHHLAVDLLRRQGPGERAALCEADLFPAAGDLPDDAVGRAELARVVRTAVAALPEEQRLVILLREFQGMSYREIATILGDSEETIRVRAWRARQALRKALAPHCGDNSAMPVTFSS